ncbi:MAG TPA: M6 family metalloprotease domain-containing protein [Candidatus Eisenbacteria bacterium]|nr:M6 family metalloprotease domain-containing protein [Candidatus Eisenbacteria bacterium]
MKRDSLTPRFLRAALSLALVAASLAATAPDARAAAPMPRPGTASASDAERSGALQSGGWDQVVIPHSKSFPQFALDLSKFPRDGVAHRNILVVLCQFSDQKPASVSTPRYYHNLFFSDDPNDGLISLREYYRTQSGGRLIISGAVTGEWLTMPSSYAYYVGGLAGLGSYPQSAQKLAEDAMLAAYELYENDLGFFDNDGPDGVSSSGDDDGYIDAVAVMVPGAGGEVSCGSPSGCTRLWAHQFGVANYAGYLPGLTLGDKRGFLYFLGSEYNDRSGDRASGTWFHEFSHTLGLPDLYDLTGSAGLGFFSLMALGNYLPYSVDPLTAGGNFGERPASLDPWSRQYLGFDEPVTVTRSGHYTLAPVTRGGGSLRIWTNGEGGTEYFLLENRVREGSDEFVPGEGLLVYHVDDTRPDNLDGPSAYRVRVVQADGLDELGQPPPGGTYSGAYGDPEDFFPGPLNKTSITEATTPSTRTLAGLDSGIRITNIAFVNDTISFDLEIAQEPVLRLSSYELDDQLGNSDGLPDPGETVRIIPTIQNVGLQSGALTLTLTTADPDITVNNFSLGAPLAPGASEQVGLWEIEIGSVTVPHVVPFTVNWTDNQGNSGSFDFTLTVGLVASLNEGFEDDGDGPEPGNLWTTESLPGSAADEWHTSTSRDNGGARSAKVGSTSPLGQGSVQAQSYASFQDAALVSPAFRIGPGLELVFDSYIDAEVYGGTDAYDGGRVEISVNGGEWTPLAVDGGYGYQIKYDSGANLRGAAVFSGSPGVWRRVTANLAGYEGSARVRFRFASDGGNYPFNQFDEPLRVFEGWYIDNVLVRSRTEVAVARRLKLRAGPSPYRIGAPSAGSIHVRFSAPDGLPHPELRPEVRIYDVAGRLVRTLAASQDGVVASEFRAVWDARDENGRELRSGIYFAKVDIQGSAESFRLVVIR